MHTCRCLQWALLDINKSTHYTGRMFSHTTKHAHHAKGNFMPRAHQPETRRVCPTPFLAPPPCQVGVAQAAAAAAAAAGHAMLQLAAPWQPLGCPAELQLLLA